MGSGKSKSTILKDTELNEFKNLTSFSNDIDVNKDGVINFREFIKFISCFIHGTLEEQMQLSFKIFCAENNKFIDKETLLAILRESISDDKNLSQFLDEKTLEKVVSNTFSVYESEENCIKYENYKVIIQKNPKILSWLKVDLDKIKYLKEENNDRFRCFS